VQAIGRLHCAARRAPDGAPVHHKRHRPEQTMLYHLAQQHAASLIAHTEAGTGSALARFIKDGFAAFVQCGIVTHGFQVLSTPTRGCAISRADRPMA
jgi:hypothetical protein